MFIRIFILYILLVCFTSCESDEGEIVVEQEKNVERVMVIPAIRLIAHRGCWSGDSLPQNSLAAFKKALRQNIFGTEFDIHQTSDRQLVINHDATYGGMIINKSTYEELSKHHLSNGETIPLLAKFLKEYREADTQVRIIVELKSCNVDDVLLLLKQYSVLPNTLFISFSKSICNQLVKKGYGSITYYLGGDLTPQDVFQLGYGGIDYSYSGYQSHPEWIKEAKELGLKVGVWTLNSLDMIKTFLADSVFVTTDKVMDVLQEQE